MPLRNKSHKHGLFLQRKLVFEQDGFFKGFIEVHRVWYSKAGLLHSHRVFDSCPAGWVEEQPDR